ncbi:hypothetical protein M0R72_03920 [Candidatus Pacearchaeota archaeon]|jgi:hypothetical protein|nr:hypothetical protein [Candidatus Pacearchaeota archaeon]
MLFEKITGQLNLSASGENAFIKRKSGEKIKIPSFDISMKLYKQATETQNPKDFEKCREFQNNFPKIKDGDVFTTGKDSTIQIDCTYDKGKDKPLEGYKNQETKNLFISGNGAEAKIIGLESWSREDKKTKTKYVGSSIKGFEILKEGFFYCSYLRTDDELITPLATLKFGSLGSNVVVDYYKGNIYTVPTHSTGLKDEHGNVKFILKNKKSYLDDSNVIKEIIVSDGAVYKKSMIQMDPIDYLTITKVSAFRTPSEMPVFKKEQILGQPKKTGEIMKQAQVSMEMFKNMSASDFDELGKSQGMSKEQIQQMKEGAEMLKTMDTKIPFEKMNKEFAKMNAYYEGVGEKGVDSMMFVQKKGMEQFKDYNSKTKTDFLKMINSPRKYGPLDSKFKVA